ncbi:DDB1- and CUL4-associated factor 7-like [Antechinus flavipes]|uniref:DDB1- and CUL4-associated factor 7-like n=1 Tax=Antechinus flavipes TaxID=38775 RepID=UPI002235BC37|nr:DDB1- and CUL4-associated factor 7-like [Antechinus flavipes]
MLQLHHQLPRKDYQHRKTYKYEAPWTVYAMNWSVRADQPFRLAIGSFVEEYGNSVQLVSLASDWCDNSGDFVCRYTLQHPYPVTKIMWMPDPQGVHPDLLATSGDYLRIWRCLNPKDVVPSVGRARGLIHRAQAVGGSVFRGRGRGIIAAAAASTVGAVSLDLDPRLECVLSQNKNNRFCSPLTSFDWSSTDPHVLATSSSDTTCTVWGLETRQILGRVSGHGEAHFTNHNKEVYDIAFGGSRDVFASVGADGTIRQFDLRRLDRSTILYQEPQHFPLLRLAWNKLNLNYMATLAMESSEVTILDLRKPGTPMIRLNRHGACVNGLTWAPHSPGQLCTAGDDCQAFIWDIQQAPSVAEEPILTYTADGEINNVQWARSQNDWVAICYKNILELLRV